MKNPVRVKLADGSETTVEASYAESKGLKVLADQGAVDRRGRALPESGRVGDDAVAVANARLAAQTAAQRSGAAKKAAATRKRAAKKTASTSKRAATKTAASGPPAGNGEGNQS